MDYIDFFIFIQFEGVGKRAITIIIVISIIAGTPLITTAETTITSGKGAIVVIITISVIAGTLLIIMAETTVIPGTRSDQIGLLKSARNISSLKVRFYNDVIVIKKSSNIDITALNNKAAIPGVTTLEASQPVNQILECERITHP